MASSETAPRAQDEKTPGAVFDGTPRSTESIQTTRSAPRIGRWRHSAASASAKTLDATARPTASETIEAIAISGRRGQKRSAAASSESRFIACAQAAKEEPVRNPCKGDVFTAMLPGCGRVGFGNAQSIGDAVRRGSLLYVRYYVQSGLPLFDYGENFTRKP